MCWCLSSPARTISSRLYFVAVFSPCTVECCHLVIMHYVDGALSDSSPYSTLKNTITVSPFSGESDICPYDNPVYCQEVRHCNMSININLANVHRVIQAFFPPEPEVMAEICHNGYKDALMFLKENDLLEQDSFMTELMINHRQDKRPWFTTHNYSEPRQSGSMSGQGCVLDKQEMNLLPESIQKVFCDASTKKHRWMRELFAVKLVTSMLMVCVLPVEVVYFMLLSLIPLKVSTLHPSILLPRSSTVHSRVHICCYSGSFCNFFLHFFFWIICDNANMQNANVPEREQKQTNKHLQMYTQLLVTKEFFFFLLHSKVIVIRNIGIIVLKMSKTPG